MSRTRDMDEFRVTQINLDEDEEVTGVRAIASVAALEVLRQFVGNDVPAAQAGPSLVRVVLNIGEVRRLHSACGQIRGDDPRSAVTGRMYDSMSMVLYSLVDTD